MKKLVSLLLVISMMFSVSVICADAENADTTQSVEITEAFLIAVRNHYRDKSIEKEDITIHSWFNIERYYDIVSYSVDGYEYTDDEIKVGLGEYILTSTRPEPVLFMLDRIFDLEYAWDHYVLDSNKVKAMYESGLYNMKESKIPLNLLNTMEESTDDEYIKVLLSVTDNRIDEVLEGVDYLKIEHNYNANLIGLKKSDIEKIAENELVISIDYISQARLKYMERYNLGFGRYLYKDVMTQYNEDGTPQYTLIHARSSGCREASAGFKFGNVVLITWSQYSWFDYQYGIYDYKEDKIYDMYELRNTPDKYDDLQENLLLYADAYIVGDSDRDWKITVMDSTKIQRIIAQLDRYEDYEFYASEDGNERGYISDFDCDGELNIMDATAIQRYVAKI